MNFQIDEISKDMSSVEKSFNKSTAYVRQLNEVLSKQQKEKELKNLTVPQVVLPL